MDFALQLDELNWLESFQNFMFFQLTDVEKHDNFEDPGDDVQKEFNLVEKYFPIDSIFFDFFG